MVSIISRTPVNMNSTSSTHTVDYPSGITTGQLLLFVARMNRSSDWNITGWNRLARFHIESSYLFARIVDGSEGSTFNVVNDAGDGRRLAGVIFQIDDWYGSIADGVGFATNSGSSPPALSPSWGEDNNQWIATFLSRHSHFDVTDSPPNYSNLVVVQNGSEEHTWWYTAATADRELVAATEDPGDFDTTGGNDASSATIAIRPAEDSIEILNGPYTAYSGETISVRTSHEPAASVTYAGVSVTLANITADGDEWTADLTVPDREVDGLGIGYPHNIVVTNASDSEDAASVENTLQPEPSIHTWHTIDGYDALQEQSDSVWWDGDDAGSVAPQDGWLGIVWNPNNLTDLTVDAAGIASAEDYGDIERQLFDPAGTGVDGQYTEVGVVSVEEEDIGVSPADSVHSQHSTSPQVSAGIVLSPASASHANVSDSPSAQVTAALTSQASTHEHRSTSPVTHAGTSLVPQGSMHSQTVTSPVLQAFITASPNNSYSDHRATQPDLSFNPMLSPTYAVHEGVGVSPGLLGMLSISPDDAIHVHAVTEPAIAQEFVVNPVFGDQRVTPTVEINTVTISGTTNVVTLG